MPRVPLENAAQHGRGSLDRMSLFIDKLGKLLEMQRLAKLEARRRKNRWNATLSFRQDVTAQGLANRTASVRRHCADGAASGDTRTYRGYDSTPVNALPRPRLKNLPNAIRLARLWV